LTTGMREKEGSDSKLTLTLTLPSYLLIYIADFKEQEALDTGH